MKKMAILCLLVIAIANLGSADEPASVYNSLAEIETMGSIYSFKTEQSNPYHMDFGDQRIGVNHQQHTTLKDEYNFGWSRSKHTAHSIKIESTGEATLLPSAEQEGLKVSPYTGPNLGPDELPYIDAEGFGNKNYAILITSRWCRWCRLMYQDTIEPLREEGYKIFIIDIDEFPDIKKRIHRLDENAEEMGAGIPYFVIRQGGKTTKIYYGYTEPDKIRPHLIKPNEISLY